MDRLTAMALFVQVVEKGSLSLAAEALDLPLSTASRGLAGLESRLNARLVKRLPRSMTPTEVGMGFYERCK
ncbi:MAG: LysR family transcriptional regulator, partial [Pigmentiphaga sp.]